MTNQRVHVSLGLRLLVLLISQAVNAQSISTTEIYRLDSVLTETSGLAWHDGAFWTHNDSGDEAFIYRLDSQGRVDHQVRIRNAENVDWESMAQDADYLYLADTGNNFNLRRVLQIYRLAWDDLAGESGEAELITVTYADHRRGSPRSHNFDAEALAVYGEQLWLFSKNRGDGQSRLYAFPKRPGNYRAAPLQSLPVGALITGADIDADSERVVLVGSRDYEATFVWWAPVTNQGVDWESVVSMEVLPNDQWEAVLWDRQTANRLWLTHEDSERGYAGLASIVLPE